MPELKQLSPIAAPLPQSTQSNSLTTNPLEASIKGTWFRSELNLREPEGSELTTSILERISNVECRKRAIRSQDASNRHELVRRLVANCLACNHHRVSPQVAYRRTSAFYSQDPCWLNGASIARTVDLLAECGLIHSLLGKWNENSSTYSPTRALLKLAGEFGATKDSIVEEMPPRRLVRLRKSNSEEPEIPFEDNDDTLAWAKRLKAYNRFIIQQRVDVETTGLEMSMWVDKLNAQKALSGLPIRRPELFRTSLYRTFNNGSFNYGGRLYGAWWIKAPKSSRSLIRINGNNTVEYDYSGCAIRMLYHEKKLEYHDDPYRLEPLWEFANENGLPENHYREAVKFLTQALINGKENGCPERARIDGFTFKPFKRLEISGMIEDKHSAIADAFTSGSGLRLQRKDSDLALSIIMKLMKQNILALPIHDSFVVEQQFEQQLIKEMDSCYHALFGFYPSIKKEE